MLKNFKLVNTDGLTGLFLKGRLIPFDKIDDTLAEQLYGKTHVLERVAAGATLAELPAAASDPDKKKSNPQAQAKG